MIFGPKSEELREWRRHYAALPQTLTDGRIIWLEHYWRRIRVNIAGVSWEELVLERYEDAPAPTTPPPLRR